MANKEYRRTPFTEIVRSYLTPDSVYNPQTWKDKVLFSATTAGTATIVACQIICDFHPDDVLEMKGDGQVG